jgi:UDP-N-acetyl-D-mannosaminuronate dehydrogenase
MDKKIGFIGLGNMGEHMAANLVKGGFDLTVHDLRPAPMRALEKLGAKTARSAQEVGERCDIIETIVVNDAQVEEVILGKDGGGALAGARPGSIIVIHSTVHPKTCQRVAALAKDKGVGVLDGRSAAVRWRPRRERSRSWWAAIQRCWRSVVRSSMRSARTSFTWVTWAWVRSPNSPTILWQSFYLC